MITARTPTRIDLAGGTLDIWPLSALFAPAVCINIGINLYATVEARNIPGSRAVTVNARHMGKVIHLERGVDEKAKTLFHRGYECFPEITGGWELAVDCMSPAGAGLGGSSSLLIAVIRTFCEISGRRMDKLQILEMAKNLEARHLGIPTGTQDYIAALQGGVSGVVMDGSGMAYRKLDVDSRELCRRLVLAYSGESRVSGKANWIMFKRGVEGDTKARKIFREIAANSLEMEGALSKKDWEEVGSLMDRENRIREKFGSSVIPPRLGKVFHALRKGGNHPKICGAGGGGCFAVFCHPSNRKRVETVIKESGMTPLKFGPGTPSLKRL